MNLYEKYKDDLEAQNFIWYCDVKLGSTEKEIDDAIVKIRKVMTLNDTLRIYYEIYDCNVVDESLTERNIK
jgi:hypothetical protein